VSEALTTLTYRLRPAGSEPRGAIVLFHGRGADENDLIPLLEALDPTSALVGITPRGPLALAPGGAHWYAVREIGHPDPQTFAATYPRVCAWIDALPKLAGVPLERTVVGGFSQGAVISYAVALGAGRPRPAGVLALSGFMPTVERYPLDLEHLTGFPVAIGHGIADPVIGVDWGRQARDRLVEAGAAVTYEESQLGHGIDPRSLPRLAAWLFDTLAAADGRGYS
jgi:phospholipase/carboxylesterase